MVLASGQEAAGNVFAACDTVHDLVFPYSLGIEWDSRACTMKLLLHLLAEE